MSTNKKNDLLVDDATVQHPKDVRGVLIKVFKKKLKKILIF